MPKGGKKAQAEGAEAAAGAALPVQAEASSPRTRRAGKEPQGEAAEFQRHDAGGNEAVPVERDFWGLPRGAAAKEVPPGDACVAAAAAVRTLAARLLQEYSAPHPCGGDGHALPGERMAAEVSSLDVWDMVSARRVTVPTLAVLLTNVISGQAAPDNVDLDMRTDHRDLQLLSTITAEEVHGMPLTGCDENGGSFQLLPEQLALALVLARGPLASQLTEEAGKQQRRIAEETAAEASWRATAAFESANAASADFNRLVKIFSKPTAASTPEHLAGLETAAREALEAKKATKAVAAAAAAAVIVARTGGRSGEVGAGAGRGRGGRGRGRGKKAAALEPEGPPPPTLYGATNPYKGVPWYSPPDDPSTVASFSMVVATMGAGKTSTVLAAALRVLSVGWEACKTNFGVWSQRTVNGDPTVIGRGRKSPDPKIPPAQKSVIPCHSKAVSRTVLIVSTSATFDQWCASAKETAEVLRPGFAEFVPCSREKEAIALFELMVAQPDTPRVAILTAEGLAQYFKEYWRVGCAVLVIDEISTHVRSLPTGVFFGEKPFPSVFRLIGLTATPSRLFRIDQRNEASRGVDPAGDKFGHLGGGNLLKGLLYNCPNGGRLLSTAPDKLAEYVGTWRRFILANVSPALQIALSERAASMMPRVVDVTTVHATTYSLADEATLALQVQRTCWPTAAYRLHFSFFHTHLSGNLLHRSSYPCTLLLDVIRLEHSALRFLAKDVQYQHSRNVLLFESLWGADSSVLLDRDAEARLNAAAGAADALGDDWEKDSPLHSADEWYRGGTAGTLDGSNALVGNSRDNSNDRWRFRTPAANIELRLNLCRLIQSGERPCAACDWVFPVREMRYCANCCALLCLEDAPDENESRCEARLLTPHGTLEAPASQKGWQPALRVCRPRPDRVTTDLAALQRRPRLLLHEALASAVASLLAAGHTRILFLSRFRASGHSRPRAHSFLAHAFAAGAAAAGRGALAVLVLSPPSKKGEINMGPVRLFRAATTPTVLCLSDSGGADEQVTGLNLGCADAVIALGRLSDEQQAFSRALRMTPGPQRERLPVVRVFPHSALSEGRGRPTARFGRATAGAAAGQPSSQQPVAAAAEAGEAVAAGRRFVDGVLEGCRTEIRDDWLQGTDEGFVSPFGRSPEWVSLSFEPAPATAAAPGTTFCGSGVPRVSLYQLAAALVSAVDGAVGSSVQFQFASPLRDPFVPRGAVALRVSVAESAELSVGGVQAVAEWVGEAQEPLRAHPDFPCNRLRITVQLAPPVAPAEPASTGAPGGSGRSSGSGRGVVLEVVAAVLEDPGLAGAAAVSVGGASSQVDDADDPHTWRADWVFFEYPGKDVYDDPKGFPADAVVPPPGAGGSEADMEEEEEVEEDEEGEDGAAGEDDEDGPDNSEGVEQREREDRANAAAAGGSGGGVAKKQKRGHHC